MKGKNYRRSKGNVYTRTKYIHGQPVSKIVKFNMGDTKTNYDYKLSLISQTKIQVRHNALEAARVSANKVLSDKLGETGYLMRIRVYPHVILRENKMIATAGADRLQEGMRRAFGKATGLAARVKTGQPVIEAYVLSDNLPLAKEGFKVASSKLGCPTEIRVTSLKWKNNNKNFLFFDIITWKQKVPSPIYYKLPTWYNKERIFNFNLLDWPRFFITIGVDFNSKLIEKIWYINMTEFFSKII